MIGAVICNGRNLWSPTFRHLRWIWKTNFIPSASSLRQCIVIETVMSQQNGSMLTSECMCAAARRANSPHYMAGCFTGRFMRGMIRRSSVRSRGS